MIYYPYFRGRQFDLRALTQFAATDYADIVPVIEPVKDLNALPKTIAAFTTANRPLAIIQNPQVGHYQYQAQQRYPINAVLDAVNIVPAFVLTPLLPPETLAANPRALIIVQHFDDLRLFIQRGWLPETAPLLAPPEARTRQLLQGRQFGHIFDHFPFPEHSADFENMTDSFYADDITFAHQYGETGFSDFLTLGHTYSEQGHPSRAVTLHLTYLKDAQVRVRHFVSDQHADFSHPKEKFFEALDKAVEWISDQPEENLTTTTTRLIALQTTHKFPGMGILKQLMIEHHLAIMSRYLHLRKTVKTLLFGVFFVSVVTPPTDCTLPVQ